MIPVSPPEHRPVENCACGGPWPCPVDAGLRAAREAGREAAGRALAKALESNEKGDGAP